MAERGERRDGDAVRITTVGRDPREDMRKRQKRYLLSMSLRTICFVGALLASGPLQWVLIGGAIFLPYVAVVLANAASRRSDDFVLGPVMPHDPELTAGRGEQDAGGRRP